MYEIKRISSLFKLKNYAIEEVSRLYYKALKKGRTQGKKLTLTIGAFIYYVCRRERYPITMNTISEKTGEDAKKLWKRYKKLKKELKLKKTSYDYTNLIYRYNNKIGLSPEKLEKVRQLYNKMSEYKNDPRVKIASAFYKMSRKSLKKISEKTKVSKSAIYNMSEKI